LEKCKFSFIIKQIIRNVENQTLLLDKDNLKSSQGFLQAQNEEYYNKNSELEAKLINVLEKERKQYVFQSQSLNSLINTSKNSQNV